MCTHHTKRNLGRLSFLADEKDNDITLDYIINTKERRHFPPIPHASNGPAASLLSCHLAAE